MSDPSTNPPDIVGAVITITAMETLRIAVAELFDCSTHQGIFLEQHASIAEEFAKVSKAWSESRLQDALDGTKAALDGFADLPALLFKSHDAIMKSAKAIGTAVKLLEQVRNRQLPQG